MNIGQIVGVGVIAGAAASASKFVADRICDYFFAEEEIIPIQAPKKKPAKGKKKPARKPKKKPVHKAKKKPTKVQKEEPKVSE